MKRVRAHFKLITCEYEEQERSALGAYADQDTKVCYSDEYREHNKAEGGFDTLWRVRHAMEGLASGFAAAGVFYTQAWTL